MRRSGNRGQYLVLERRLSMTPCNDDSELKSRSRRSSDLERNIVGWRLRATEYADCAHLEAMADGCTTAGRERSQMDEVPFAPR